MWISSRERRRLRPRTIPVFLGELSWDRMEGYLFGSTGLWVTIFVVGGFAEEHWRAVTLRAFQQAGWDPGFPIVLTSLVFGFAYGVGLPPRGGQGLFSVFGSASWRALMAQIFLTTGSWGVPCIANIVCNLSNRLIRRMAMAPAGADVH
jgi:hypothetical protein